MLRARAEAQQETRRRIAAAAAGLHEEVGVARTTVADIARRAGVQRLTVYNHFPTLAELLPACTAHWFAEHPLPDLEAPLALADPAERLRTVLTELYVWYRDGAAMQERILGERSTVSELDVWLAQARDPLFASLTEALSQDGNRALVALALDFWTWRRLAAEGFEDGAAAALMADVVRRG